MRELIEVTPMRQCDTSKFMRKMYNRRWVNYGLAVFLCLVSASACVATQPPDPRYFEGTMWSDTKDSTGILHYDLTIYNTGPDSVVLILGRWPIRPRMGDDVKRDNKDVPCRATDCLSSNLTSWRCGAMFI